MGPMLMHGSNQVDTNFLANTRRCKFREAASIEFRIEVDFNAAIGHDAPSGLQNLPDRTCPSTIVAHAAQSRHVKPPSAVLHGNSERCI